MGIEGHSEKKSFILNFESAPSILVADKLVVPRNVKSLGDDIQGKSLKTRNKEITLLFV